MTPVTRFHSRCGPELARARSGWSRWLFVPAAFAAIVLCVFAIAFSEGGSWLGKLMWVALGLSIAVAATTMTPVTRFNSRYGPQFARRRSGWARWWFLVTAFAAAPCFATTTGGAAPWEAPLNTFLTSLTGPVAQMVGVAAIVLCGFAIAFSEGGSGLRKLVWVALGLSIAFAATTFFLPLFGYTAGLAI